MYTTINYSVFVPNITQLHKNRVNMDMTLRLNAAQYCPHVFLCITSILRIASSIFTRTVYYKITQLIMQQQKKTDQSIRLNTKAVTLLPVTPPNWKRGVGSSRANSNPARNTVILQSSQYLKHYYMLICEVPGLKIWSSCSLVQLQEVMMKKPPGCITVFKEFT